MQVTVAPGSFRDGYIGQPQRDGPACARTGLSAAAARKPEPV